MIEEVYESVFMIDHDDECECEYDDDLKIVWFCRKDVCPNDA